MYNHAPANYICPLCLAVNGIESEDTMMKQDDIVYRDDTVIAAISSKFVKKNPGHVIVFPVQHFENIYDLQEKEASQTILIAKQVSLALKEVRKCDGITLLQNNEPASEQHAFHFHLHIFPRFTNDGLSEHIHQPVLSGPDERKAYAEALKKYFVK